MIIQLRKKYKTREGETVKIVEKINNQQFLGSNQACYYINGRFGNQEQSCDLVEEL